MANLDLSKLKAYSPIFPMLVKKYAEFVPDQNASVLDKINAIIAELNAIGQLSNNVVKDWNTVYNWVMNDGLTQAVQTNNSVIQIQIGDLTQLTTDDKNSLVESINELKSLIPSSVGSGVLVYNTLSDLQTAYPNGTTQPAWVIADNEWYYWSGTVVNADTTAPVITASSSGGTFSSAQTVTLSSNETATIYYTLDGSTPTTSSSVYSSALTISSTSTLKFFGKDTAGNSSTVQSVTFTITAADTTAPTISISPAAGTYTGTQTVTLSANETATIYYTTDGSTPTTSSAVYSEPISVSATETIKYFGKDIVGNSSVVQSATYTINADTTPPVITASPAAGTYTSSQSVTLSSNETGTTIYYTTDGTTPTTASTVYTAPITISATETLQFIGKDAAGNISAPVAANYTINIAQASGTAIVTDSFNRANSTTGLGTADTGQSWVSLQGVYGISNNQAQIVTGTGGSIYDVTAVASGYSDCTVQATVTAKQAYQNIAVRVSDKNHFIMFRNDANNSYKVYSVNGTVFTDIGGTILTATTPAVNDVLKVILNGSSIQCFVNGTKVYDITSTYNQTSTMHGICGFGTNIYSFDNFSIVTN